MLTFSIYHNVSSLVSAELIEMSSVITSRPKKACIACRSSLNELLVMLRSDEFAMPVSEKNWERYPWYQEMKGYFTLQVIHILRDSSFCL